MTAAALTVLCPYCGAAPFEPCRNQRTTGQQGHGSGSTATASVMHTPTKRPHPERRPAATS